MSQAGNREDPIRIDYYGSDIFRSGRVPQPHNYYFVTEMRKTRQNELYIPMHVIKEFDVQLPDEMTVVDARGRRGLIQRKDWLDGRVVYTGRWKAFCKWNLARPRDKIICEFVRGDAGDQQLSVTFVPSESDRQQG